MQKQKSVSYGVLLLTEPGLLLMGRATGAGYWDVFKGGADGEETAYAAAIRETREESGVVLQEAQLLDLGRMAYRREKDLHLFAVVVAQSEVLLSQCKCTSFYAHPRTGKLLPEISEYKWVPFKEIAQYAARNMTRVLTEGLNLPRLLQETPLSTCHQVPL